MNINDLFFSRKVTSLWVFISCIILTVLAGLFMVIGAALGLFFTSVKRQAPLPTSAMLVIALILLTLILLLLLILLWLYFRAGGKELSADVLSLLPQVVQFMALLIPFRKEIYCAIQNTSNALTAASNIVGHNYDFNSDTGSDSLTKSFKRFEDRFSNFNDHLTSAIESILPTSAKLPQVGWAHKHGVVDLHGTVESILGALNGQDILTTPPITTLQNCQFFQDIISIHDYMLAAKEQFSDLATNLYYASSNIETIAEHLLDILNPNHEDC